MLAQGRVAAVLDESCVEQVVDAVGECPGPAVCHDDDVAAGGCGAEPEAAVTAGGDRAGPQQAAGLEDRFWPDVSWKRAMTSRSAIARRINSMASVLGRFTGSCIDTQNGRNELALVSASAGAKPYPALVR